MDISLEVEATGVPKLASPLQRYQCLFLVLRITEKPQMQQKPLEIAGVSIISGNGVIQAFGNFIVKFILLLRRKSQEIVLFHHCLEAMAVDGSFSGSFFSH